MDVLKIVKSRQFWTIVVLFVINGVEGVKDVIPVLALPYINTVLGLLALYFRIKPKQQF